MGTRVESFELAEVVEELAFRLDRAQRTRVFFVNAHCFNVARSDAHYRACLERAEIVLPDGSGVLMAARVLGVELRRNLNGTDLVPLLLRRVAQDARSVFVLGGRPGVAAEAAKRLAERNPGLKVAGHAHGYLDAASEREVLAELDRVRPDILLIGQGVPLQESWLDRHWDRLPVGLGLAVGGLIDFTAGVHPRAPRWMRALGIEWVFRLIQEPRRLARRYLVGNVVFLADVVRRKVTP